MKTWQNILIGVGIAAAILIGFFIGRESCRVSPQEPQPPKVDTLYLRDTIKVAEAISVTMRVVDSIYVPADTIRMRDTLFVYLEREQVRWEDSLAVVYASGVNPQVDSVIHHTQQMVITKEIPVIYTTKTRWGIGIQAGVGASKDGLTPYIGVGLTYNLLSW